MAPYFMARDLSTMGLAKVIPVCGDAAGVAKQMCVAINNRQRMPKAGIPTELAKVTTSGIIIMMMIRLVAKLVKIAPRPKASKMNT